MRHRIPLLSTGLVLGLLAMGAGTAQAQDSTQPSEKTLQKQCLTLAQRDSARDNSNMAAPAPAVSDSIRMMCDSVNAANPDYQEKLEKQHKNKYPDAVTPDSVKTEPDTTAADTAATTSMSAPVVTPVSPATPAVPPVTTSDSMAQPAMPDSTAAPAPDSTSSSPR